MKKTAFAFLLASLLPIAPPAFAQSIGEKNLLKGKVTLLSGEGYIYLESDGRFIGTLLREPDAADVEAHAVEQEAA